MHFWGGTYSSVTDQLRTRDARAAVDGRAEREREGARLLIDGASRRFQHLVRRFVSEDLFINLADGGVVHDLLPSFAGGWIRHGVIIAVRIGELQAGGRRSGLLGSTLATERISAALIVSRAGGIDISHRPLDLTSPGAPSQILCLLLRLVLACVPNLPCVNS